MNFISYNGENFDDLISKGIVIVDFYSDWCGPCQMLMPQLEEFSNLNKDIKVIKINASDYSDLSQKYSVLSVPTLLLFVDGNIKSVESGFKTKEMLQKWVDENK